jgi:hypothetical protein
VPIAQKHCNFTQNIPKTLWCNVCTLLSFPISWYSRCIESTEHVDSVDRFLEEKHIWVSYVLLGFLLR